MPDAATLKLAGSPSVTAALDGCAVIEGGTTAAFTVSVAVALVTLPAVFVTTTS